MSKKIVAIAGLIAVVSMFVTPALARYRSYGPYPAACQSVFFPRSPLCAGIPAYRELWYEAFPYNWIVYY